MPATGGSIIRVNVWGRDFPVAADSDATVKLGGFENERQSNGDGSNRSIKTRTGWSLADINLSLDDARGDHEYLQDVSDSPEDGPISWEQANGRIYQATGGIAGEVPKSLQSTTIPMSFGGGGKATPQA